MFRKRKKNSSTYAYVLREKARQDISRRSRAVMAKKCSKKCDAWAAWLSLSNLLLFFLLYVRDVNFLAAWVAKLPASHQ